MKFNIQLVLAFEALLVLGLVNSQKVRLENVKPCPNVQKDKVQFNFNETTIYVDPSPCVGGSEIPHCKVARGTKVSLEAHFTANQNTSTVRQQVLADLVGGLRVIFPGLKSNACKSGNVKCPVIIGSPMVYTVSFMVQPFYPTVNGNATVNLRGTEGTLFCFMFPVEVV